jgi:hypothetical protein
MSKREEGRTTQKERRERERERERAQRRKWKRGDQ